MTLRHHRPFVPLLPAPSIGKALPPRRCAFVVGCCPWAWHRGGSLASSALCQHLSGRGMGVLGVVLTRRPWLLGSRGSLLILRHMDTAGQLTQGGCQFRRAHAPEEQPFRRT